MRRTMLICREIATLRTAVAGIRTAGESIGLVTTMGALHEGHMALVAAARADHERVATTIIVNPTQFGDPKDLETYPRTEETDLALFEAAGVDAVLIPTAAEIYPAGDETIVETTHLAGLFHGAVRPGHFRGVATVVAKLFNIVQPDAAYFGEKDYQQLAVIRRMVRDLHFPLQIVGVPTVREADGLAMSSRNARLTAEDRKAAVVLNAALTEAERIAAAGGDIAALDTAIRTVIASEPRACLKGLDIVDPEAFRPATGPLDATVGVMVSAEFGGILLLDQREIGPKGAP